MAKKKIHKKKKIVEPADIDPSYELGTIMPSHKKGFEKEPKVRPGPPTGWAGNTDYISLNWNKKFVQSQIDIENMDICDGNQAVFMNIIGSFSGLFPANSRGPLLERYRDACDPITQGGMKFSELLSRSVYERYPDKSVQYEDWRKMAKEFIEKEMNKSSNAPKTASKVMTEDQLQNEIIFISHHLDDMEKGIEENDLGYVKRGLDDVKESVYRLKKFLTHQNMVEEIDRISEDD
jgi:hypothetical protein